MRKRAAVPKEIAKPGTPGRLQATAHIDNEPVHCDGAFYYVGQLPSGMLAFAPAEPFYLEPHEVKSFETRPGT